jgi:hypothetical protein
LSSVVTKSWTSAAFAADSISAAVASGLPKRMFSLTVPAKMVGSCST